jgi:hypothetical protein
MDLMNRPPSEREARRAQAGREELAERVARAVGEDGAVELPGGLRLLRASAPTPEAYGVSSPAFCVIAQGSKEVWLGDDCYRYDANRYLMPPLRYPPRAGSPRRPRSGHTWASSSSSTPPSSARSWSRPVTPRPGTAAP